MKRLDGLDKKKMGWNQYTVHCTGLCLFSFKRRETQISNLLHCIKENKEGLYDKSNMLTTKSTVL